MKQVKVLGIPFSHGQKHKGVSLAPDLLRQEGLISRISSWIPCRDEGDISLPLKDKDCSESNFLISQKILSLDLKDSFLLNIGGDHGMALGTIHGILEKSPDSIIIWADAHGDINTPDSSLTGNFHGMPLAYLIGLVEKEKNFSWIKNHLDPRKLIYFGPRDLDEEEKKIISRLNITYFSSKEINQKGAFNLLDKAIREIDPHDLYPIHLSFDVDILDPAEISATGTRVEEGPRLEEVQDMLIYLAQTQRLNSMDVVELNPELGSDLECKQSVSLVLELIILTLRHSVSRRSAAHSA